MRHRRAPTPAFQPRPTVGDCALCGAMAVAAILALAFGGVCLSRAAAAAAPAPPEVPAASPAPPPLPVDVTGATVIEYDDRTQQYTFRGPRVVIARGVQRLEAPEVLYSAAGRRVVLPQGGVVSMPAMELSADRILADLVSRHIEAEGRVAGRFLDGGVWTSLTAARVVADDQPGRRQAEATGNVVAVRQDEELHADRVVYDRSTLRGVIEGHTLLIRGEDTLRADRIDVDLGAREARAAGHVLLDRAAQSMHASAEEATYSGRTETAVLSGHPVVTRDRDSLTADRLTVHLDQNLVAADGHAQIMGFPAGTGP